MEHWVHFSYNLPFFIYLEGSGSLEEFLHLSLIKCFYMCKNAMFSFYFFLGIFILETFQKCGSTKCTQKQYDGYSGLNHKQICSGVQNKPVPHPTFRFSGICLPSFDQRRVISILYGGSLWTGAFTFPLLIYYFQNFRNKKVLV